MSQTQRKLQACNRCSAAGFPNQLIGFEKLGEDPTTGKIKWKLVDENGVEHQHKGSAAKSYGSGNKYKRILDVAFITDITEARKLLALGWDYQTAFPTTVANIPTLVMVKKEA